MNKKGFTLIELLAVIIILGILMIIAIPSVTRYISDSRKSAYVDTAKEIIGSARNLVNAGKLEMYDTDATYYLDVKCVKTENAMKSPYGDFVDNGAYVVVTYDGKGYSYFWTSVDDAGQGVKDIVSYDKLDTDSIESDLTTEDIKTNRTLDGRKKIILITDRNHCQKEGAITENLEQVSSGGNTPSTPTTAATQIKIDKANQLKRIGTTNNYIFKGGNPANYVKFNCSNPSDTSTCENWRIIGIYGDKIKIQRTTALASQTYHGTQQYTGWANSRLYGYLNQETSGGYYYSLHSSAKSMIEAGDWYAGASVYNETAIDAYISATETTVIAKVGLMATYEFLYASDGESCETKSGNVDSFNTTCGTADHDWMKPSYYSWTLSPNRQYTYYANYVDMNGYIGGNIVSNVNSALPAVFLDSSVTLAAGSGSGTSISDAYVFTK